MRPQQRRAAAGDPDVGAPPRCGAGRAVCAHVRRSVGAGDVRRGPHRLGAHGSAHRLSAGPAGRRLAANHRDLHRDRAGLVRRGPHRRRQPGPPRGAGAPTGDGALPLASAPVSAMLSGMARIAIVGGGSIGEALLSGLLRAGRQVKDLVVAERMPERAKYLADTYSVLVTSVSDAVENATFVVVAVKPADVESVMGELARAAGRRRERQRRAGVRHRRGRDHHHLLRVQAAGRDAGGPGDAERGGTGRRRGHRAGQGPVRHGATARGGLGPVRLPSAAC